MNFQREAASLLRPTAGLTNFTGSISVWRMASQVQKNLQAAMREALRIQDRFVPEPLFAKTGRGYLKSEGVATLQKIKASLRRKTAAKAK